jgi:sucrose-phosphate synthase
MRVIPPGVDLERFRPPRRNEKPGDISAELARFLRDPAKPMILALSRPDERKNIATLIRAYGEHPGLRDKANLVIVAGNRDDVASMEKGPRGVLTDILMLIDRYDLYGHVAYPKQHQSSDVPDLFRLAAKTQGVFINPALTEPFGLTLIEAAASGLPMVATRDGGPIDIVEHCSNGILIDPLDADAMGDALLDALSDTQRWKRWSRNGLRGAQQHYSWQAHATRYLKEVTKEVARLTKSRRSRLGSVKKSRLPSVDRILVCDVDDTLLGDRAALDALLERLHDGDANVGLAVATGRGLESTRKVLKDWDVPDADVLITSVGSEIYYGSGMSEDPGWRAHLGYRWRADALREAMKDIRGVRLQPKSEQRKYKISYYVDPEKMPSPREIQRHLRQLDLHAKVIYSHQAYLDLLPVRASKGLAVRYLAMKWGIEPERWLVAGDSGNDEEMLSGNTLGVVVSNYSPELERLRGRPRIYFADADHAWGILEGIDHYDFLGTIRLPEEEDEIA